MSDLVSLVHDENAGGAYLNDIHGVFLNQLAHQTDTAVIGSNLSLEIGHVVLEATSTT